MLKTKVFQMELIFLALREKGGKLTRFQHSCIFVDSKLLIIGGRGPEVSKSKT